MDGTIQRKEVENFNNNWKNYGYRKEKLMKS